VVQDIFRDSEITAGYFLSLTVANLIALCGLITNSARSLSAPCSLFPHGAILASVTPSSPGPLHLSRSVRKIVVSVTVTIIVATIATFLSPVTDLTTEIVSRTHPNLYDLIVAILAGIAGAGAICNKKGFLTVVQESPSPLRLSLP